MTRLIWSLGLPALLVAAMYALGAQAHDPEGKYNDWFLAQTQEESPAKCCGLAEEHGGDAHYVEVISDGKDHYVFIEGIANPVLYPGPVNPYHYNATGRNVVWYHKVENSITFYCLRLATGS